MKTRYIVALGLFLVLMLLPQFVSAQWERNMTQEDKEAFDRILEPVGKIYNLIKYVATGIAALVLLLSGVNYMMSGSDPKRRESAKSMAMYVIIGLIIIWAAPLVVKFIVG